MILTVNRLYKRGKLDHVGCFEYSNVEGATAKLMSDQIPDIVKRKI